MNAAMPLLRWSLLISFSVACFTSQPPICSADDPPASAPDKTDVRPLEKLESESSGPNDVRGDLIDALGELIAQEDAKRQLLKELRAAFDGSARMALKIHLVELMVLEDQARMLPLVSRTGEKLRWDVARDLKHKERMAANRAEAVKSVDAEIEKLADLIVASEADDPGDTASLERELIQRKLQRREADAKGREYAALADARKRELADLGRLKKWIAANRREATIRNERLRDAVEHEHTALLAEQVDAGRQRLKDALTAFHARQKDDETSIDSSSDNPVRDGVPITNAVDAAVRSAPLSDDERKLIEEELVKARERKAALNR